LESAYVGAYIADMVVDNKIIIELKSVSKLNEVTEVVLQPTIRLSNNYKTQRYKMLKLKSITTVGGKDN